MSNAKRALEVGQSWPDLSQPPASLSDCVRYVRSCHTLQGPHLALAADRCADAAAVMYIRHPEYFT